MKQIFLSLYRGLKDFVNPVVYRIDLSFEKGFSPSEDNQEIKSFIKNTKSQFERENTKFKGKSSFKIFTDNQVSKRGQTGSQYADKFTPIIIWSKEKSSSTIM